jgi:hypothetical protein
MHTAICAFDTREQAERARDGLLRAGFARHDLHIEHKEAAGEQEDANSTWDGMEREIAVDPEVLSSFGRFFARLLGRDHSSGHVDTYAQHVERGAFVLVVDADNEAEARRAEAALRDLQAGELNVVHRPAKPPLRDLVGRRQEPGTAGMVERSREPYEGWTGAAPSPGERDRALASHTVSPRTGPDLRDPDVEHAPGLRYADKDKPL